MKYYDKTDVMIGDKVDLGKGEIGIVVCIIEDSIYYVGYNASDWSHLKNGLVVNSKTSGDVYFSIPDEDTTLISREHT